MNSKQKHILAILLGFQVGITLFFIFYSNPALSAWIPGTQTPYVQTNLPESEYVLSTTPTLPVVVTNSQNSYEFPPTATTTSNTLVLQPVVENPPPNPSLLAQSFPETFAQTPPIWAHNTQPVAEEIVLFRHAFEITDSTEVAEIQIFADTRYEVWLDGEWIGRGPARFSCTLREYDVYPLQTLTPGRHLIAVLVQWAPNNRRSESNTPILQARLQNYTTDGPVTLLQTGPDWNIYATTAWNPDAGPVHSWNLIGPMELLDLNHLPLNWMQPEFADFQWAKAVSTVPFVAPSKNKTWVTQICARRGITTATLPIYQPRSIAILASNTFTPTILEAGWLSPNRMLIQPLLTAKQYEFTVHVVKPIIFSVEVLALSSTDRLTATVQLDNLALSWLPAGDNRPDVWVGLIPVQPGLHTLTHHNVAAYPVFNIFTDGLQLNPYPVVQGTEPGYRMLLSEPIPDLTVLTPLSGEGIQVRLAQTPTYLVLELPRVVHGRLTAEVLGPPGTIIDIGWDEKLYQYVPDGHVADASIANGLMGRPLPFPGSLHPQWSQVDSWILDGNYRELTTLDARTGRYILITIWGNGPVELHNLRVAEEQYPVTQRGAFTTSSDRLNKIWQVGVDTAQLNLLDAYADPWRERGQWWGDAFIVDRTTRVSFGEMALLRRGLMYMADGFRNGEPVALAPQGQDNHMVDYGMLWVQSLESYATLTQDQSLVSRVYPTLKAFLVYLEKRTTGGLLSVPRGHWSQSSYIDSRAKTSRYGQSAAVNAMYYGALLSAANIADMQGDPTSAKQWRAQAEIVKQQINARLYLPDEGRYAASLLSGRLYPPDPYAQAWPLVYGIVPDTEIPRVVAALQELLIASPQDSNVDVYGMNWVLEALARNGYIPEMLGLLERYYGYMLDAGATTWWETFTSPDRYDSAQSHGWGSSPTWMLTTYLLGGRWTGPDAWTVRPALQGVTSASGILPIGEGEVDIHWDIESCALINIEIRAPSHTTGELVLPLTDVTALSLNGVIILKDGSSLIEDVSVQADGIHISVSKRPNYRFIVERACP